MWDEKNRKVSGLQNFKWNEDLKGKLNPDHEYIIPYNTFTKIESSFKCRLLWHWLLKIFSFPPRNLNKNSNLTLLSN